MRTLRLGFVRLPARRLLHLEQRQHRDDDGDEPAEEHRAPAVMRADGVVERRGHEESEVVSRLQIAGAHRAPVLRPRLGDVRAGHRPLAADTDAGEEPERAELPHVLRERRRAGEEGVDEDRGRERLGASEAVGDGTPEERASPAHEEEREHHGTDVADARGGDFHSRLRQELGERGREDEGIDDRVHAVERPSGPRGPEADDLLAVESRSH